MIFRAALIFFALAGSSPRAEISIQIVYPSHNQEIAAVDSTFIFGSVTPGSKLRVNDVEVTVHPDGGWLAFTDITQGQYRFHLTATYEGDTTWLEWPVQVGPKETGVSDRYMPRAIDPEKKAIYRVGGTFEFKFEAPAGGVGWFYFDQRPPIKMFNSPLSMPVTPGDVFGQSSRNALDSSVELYTGYYKFTEADTGLHRICYLYKANALANVENPVVYENCIDSLVAVNPEFPPLIGVLVGTSHIVRSGPGLGFKLLYLPPGILVNVTGKRDDFYELSLANDITGYINVDSVMLLPEGTPIPRGRVSYITVDSADGDVRISADVGIKLPYELIESGDARHLDIDIFGVTGDVDWIRYNVRSPLARVITWSQPLDGVFRISIDADYIWGYKAFYDSTEFTLLLTRKPNMRGVFRGNFGGTLRGVKIAIDPGHSSDFGAVGPTGFKEKDANLWISHELRKMLEAKGAEVLMTRYGHEHVPLYARPDKAEKWGADVLVSIHNNALPDGINPIVNNGTSAYYYFPHSKPLAEAIHRRMLKRTGLRDHGLYSGNLVLTRCSTIPSVLVECAFMMIPEQEAMLKSDRFQRQCAKAIVQGIEDFLKSKR
jgi:N-acetylmuramoyl-L-alanine amidase